MSEKSDQPLNKTKFDYATSSLQAIHKELFGGLPQWDYNQAMDALTKVVAYDQTNNAQENFELSRQSAEFGANANLPPEIKAQRFAETAAFDLALAARLVSDDFTRAFLRDSYYNLDKAIKLNPTTLGTHALIGADLEFARVIENKYAEDKKD